MKERKISPKKNRLGNRVKFYLRKISQERKNKIVLIKINIVCEKFN